MTLMALRRSGFASAKVIGTGTLLDTSRLKQTLAESLQVTPGSIDGLVLGEHGDSEVAAFSTVRVGGLPLSEFCPPGQELDQGQIATEVRDAGYRIVQGKGYTSFGVATAIVRICEAILRNERAVLPVSTLLTGQYGIADVCLSLPCILGAGGVERILSPALHPLGDGGIERVGEGVTAGACAYGSGHLIARRRGGQGSVDATQPLCRRRRLDAGGSFRGGGDRRRNQSLTSARLMPPGPLPTGMVRTSRRVRGSSTDTVSAKLLAI